MFKRRLKDALKEVKKNFFSSMIKNKRRKSFITRLDYKTVD